MKRNSNTPPVMTHDPAVVRIVKAIAAYYQIDEQELFDALVTDRLAILRQQMNRDADRGLGPRKLKDLMSEVFGVDALAVA